MASIRTNHGYPRLALLVAGVLCYNLFGYSTSENVSKVDDAEMQLQMVRMFIQTLKLNVTAEEGKFPLKQYPDGADFGSYDRTIHVAKKSGTVRVDDTDYATTHEIWIKEGAQERNELYAALGEQGSLKIGLFAVLAGETDLSKALATVRFVIDESTGKASLEVETPGWSFDREDDVISCKDANGGYSEYKEGKVCIYPPTVNPEELKRIGEAIEERVGIAHEDFLSVAEEHGLSCQ